jgi:8-oxo-dGTP pyrophosphatase MutT (NUDIX family)
MTQIDKIAWIEIQDKKILSTKSFGKDKYYIPGGKREANETDSQTLLREIKEELTVDLDSNSLQLIGIFEAHAHGLQAGVSVKMTCYSANFAGVLKPSSEIEEMVWLTMADRDKISKVDQAIFDYLHQNKWIE